VGKTMPFLPPMTGNGLFIPPIKMVMTRGWFMTLFYPHYSKSSKSNAKRRISGGKTNFTIPVSEAT
jgi:hypothetical protein